ncbi:MAG TPA: thioredoxin domain-containing protein [Anaerolineae bacterium]|nr:thioredoxin domain-containing protein [Anaerolineae bacterium]
MKANRNTLTQSVKKKQSLKVVGLGLFIVSALIVSSCSSAASPAAPSSAATPALADPAPMNASPVLGPDTAPVTIVEYGDFGCTTCLGWYRLGVLNQLRAKYGDQIRFVWRDLPIITALSPNAAEAGQCANEQGKFWEFYNAVYQHNVAIEASDLQAYAADIGLDKTKFNDCVTSQRYQDRVNAELHEGLARLARHAGVLCERSTCAWAAALIRL